MEMDSHTSGLDIWHIDEMFIKAMNTEWYLWGVIDQNSKCLAIYLSLYRDMKSAVSALSMAKEFALQIPDIVVSDNYNAYPRAVRTAFGWRSGVRHVQAHFEPVIIRHKGIVMALTNNRIEGFNSWLRERVTILHGFKNDYCMERYLEGFQKVWNMGKFFVFSLIGLTEPARHRFAMNTRYRFDYPGNEETLYLVCATKSIEEMTEQLQCLKPGESYTQLFVLHTNTLL